MAAHAHSDAWRYPTPRRPISWSQPREQRIDDFTPPQEIEPPRRDRRHAVAQPRDPAGDARRRVRIMAERDRRTDHVLVAALRDQQAALQPIRRHRRHYSPAPTVAPGPP